MKKLLLFLIVLPLSYLAQEVAVESINCTGGSMFQSNGSLSFTVGELVVLSFEDDDGNTLNGGFPSGAVSVSTVSVAENDNKIMTVNVYPNPTSELITVEVIDPRTDAFQIEIFDHSGRLISVSNYSALTSKIGINCSDWTKGSYILNIKSKNQENIGVYQIIKQ